MINVERVNWWMPPVSAAFAFVVTVGASPALALASPAVASPGSWELTDCRAEPGSGFLAPAGTTGALSGKLRIHNLDEIRTHSYSVKVVWNEGSDRLGSTETYLGPIEPGQTQDFDVWTYTSSATVGEMSAGPVSCGTEYVRDDNDETVVEASRQRLVQ
jgi:hypothetical protein